MWADRTRRLVIGEIRILWVGGSRNARDVGPGPVPHRVAPPGRTVLCPQRMAVIVVSGGWSTSCRLPWAAVTGLPAVDWSHWWGSKTVWLRTMAKASR